ncbi:MAG: hypothetical protein AAB408_03420 [Patescibacteria group bacterium]
MGDGKKFDAWVTVNQAVASGAGAVSPKKDAKAIAQAEDAALRSASVAAILARVREKRAHELEQAALESGKPPDEETPDEQRRAGGRRHRENRRNVPRQARRPRR